MTIPHDDIIKLKLLELLDKEPNGTMHCNEVFKELAREFPMLTKAELTDPYQTSQSHWANRVQWARQHLAEEGCILRPNAGGVRGYWTITQAGRKALHEPIDIPDLQS